MADKKRDRKKEKVSQKRSFTHGPQNFDDEIERIKQETLSAVVEREVYPRGNNSTEDDTQIYATPMEKYKKGGRYQQDAETVAQNMADRTQFRH